MARTPYKWFNINRIGPGKRINGKSGKYFGHITRGGAGQLALTVLEGIMEGLRHQGRQRRQWIHDIEEWTGCEFIQLKEMSQDRAQWRRKISEWSSAVANPHRGRSTSEWVSAWNHSPAPLTKSVTNPIIPKMASVDKYIGDDRLLFDCELQL